ncbi:MAG TPA: hypothetical protein VGR55_05840 [Candidatus Acidoferrum sp.]|nr:hypothetical protein [Candidatus Acidoferrum sp.]
MTEKSFPILIEHRPRRVAFLVDLQQEAVGEVLAGILRFNLDSWGGRHNPVVPLVDKKIPDAWFALLDVADPDVFYIYGEADLPTLEALHSRYAPTFVTQHMLREPTDSHSYGVHLREQVNVRKYLSNIAEKVPVHLGRKEPCLLQLEFGEERSLSQFFLWNFGYTTSNYFAIRDHDIAGCRPKSTADRDLVELFATQMNLAWPIHVCADAPLGRTAGDTWRSHFPIFCGDSPWNLVAYWNDGLTTGRATPVHGGINQLWISPKTLEDEAVYKQLVLLLRRWVYSGNPQKGLKMISYDTPEQELERVGKRIVGDIYGHLHYGGCIKLDPPHVADTVEPRRAASTFVPARQEVQYATGKDVHLALRRPAVVEEGADELWMVDVLVYNPEQELWYSNATPWWCLPRKPSIAGLFVYSRPQRIISDRRISFEVHARETTLDFEIPSNAKLFRYLLSPEIRYHLAGDARSSLRSLGTELYEIRLSDKGRYLSGIENLFGSLRDMLHFFEHPFWRPLLKKLSEKKPSEQLVKKLASDVQRLAKEAWAKGTSEFQSWLTQEIIFASKGLSKAPLRLTYDSIEKEHETYVQGLPEEEKQSYRRDLRSDLSELTQSNVVFQGAELRCPNCLSSYWYSVEEMRKTILCRGCHTPFPLLAETEWSYQLNELVRAGVGDHGLLSVLRTLARLFDKANDSFFFTPSVEFLVYPNEGEPKAERELDLAWVKDGAFGIAEVKETTKLFKQGDYDDIASLAKMVRPDIVLIAAPDGNDGDLGKGKKAIEEKLALKCEVWAWGPAEFKKSPHWTQW